MAKLSAHQSPIKKYEKSSHAPPSSATSDLARSKTASLDDYRRPIYSRATERAYPKQDNQPVDLTKDLAELNINTKSTQSPGDSQEETDDATRQLSGGTFERLSQERLARREALQKLAASKRPTSRGYRNDRCTSEEAGHEDTLHQKHALDGNDGSGEEGDDSHSSLDGFIVSDDAELSTYSSSLGSDDEYVEEEERSQISSPASASSIRRSAKRRPKREIAWNNSSSTQGNFKNATPSEPNISGDGLHESLPDENDHRGPGEAESDSTAPEEQLYHELAIYHEKGICDTPPTPKDTPPKTESSDQDHADTSSFPPPKELKVSVTTPPRLLSPTKPARSRIPPSPHRPSMDAFWNQDFIDDWNIKHSAQKPFARKPLYPNKEKPRNTATPLSRKMDASVFRIFEDEDDVHGFAGSGGESGGELIKENKKPLTVKKRLKSSTTASSTTAAIEIEDENENEKSPSKRALAAQKTQSKKETAAKKREFDQTKRTKASEFLKDLDDRVTGGEVHRLAVPGGGLQIIWNKTLNSTAGRATWKRPSATEAVGESPSKANKLMTANIELAEKIIDDEKRLYNTLAHEYCHLTNFMVSRIIDQPHGASFKNWAKKCMEVLDSHDTYAAFGVQITTKHDYKINYRYIWNCETCGYEYGRHSKSINVNKVRCGSCNVGRLVQVKPKPRKVTAKKEPSGPKTGKSSGAATGYGDRKDTMPGDIFDELTRRVEVVDLD